MWNGTHIHEIQKKKEVTTTATTNRNSLLVLSGTFTATPSSQRKEEHTNKLNARIRNRKSGGISNIIMSRISRVLFPESPPRSTSTSTGRRGKRSMGYGDSLATLSLCPPPPPLLVRMGTNPVEEVVERERGRPRARRRKRDKMQAHLHANTNTFKETDETVTNQNGRMHRTRTMDSSVSVLFNLPRLRIVKNEVDVQASASAAGTQTGNTGRGTDTIDMVNSESKSKKKSKKKSKSKTTTKNVKQNKKTKANRHRHNPKQKKTRVKRGKSMMQQQNMSILAKLDVNSNFNFNPLPQSSCETNVDREEIQMTIIVSPQSPQTSMKAIDALKVNVNGDGDVNVSSSRPPNLSQDGLDSHCNHDDKNGNENVEANTDADELLLSPSIAPRASKRIDTKPTPQQLGKHTKCRAGISLLAQNGTSTDGGNYIKKSAELDRGNQEVLRIPSAIPRYIHTNFMSMNMNALEEEDDGLMEVAGEESVDTMHTTTQWNPRTTSKNTNTTMTTTARNGHIIDHSENTEKEEEEEENKREQKNTASRRRSTRGVKPVDRFTATFKRKRKRTRDSILTGTTGISGSSSSRPEQVKMVNVNTVEVKGDNADTDAACGCSTDPQNRTVRRSMRSQQLTQRFTLSFRRKKKLKMKKKTEKNTQISKHKHKHEEEEAHSRKHQHKMNDSTMSMSSPSFQTQLSAKREPTSMVFGETQCEFYGDNACGIIIKSFRDVAVDGAQQKDISMKVKKSEKNKRGKLCKKDWKDKKDGNRIRDDASSTDWDFAQVEHLKRANGNAIPTSSTFWQDIACAVPEKSAEDCRDKWFAMVGTPTGAGKTRPTDTVVDDAHVDENEDDIFNSTPIRNASMGNTNSAQINLTRRLSDIFSSPILIKARKEEKNTNTRINDATPPLIRHQYKKYLKEVKAGINNKVAAMKSKTVKATKANKSLSATFEQDDFQVEGILSPGGTLHVDAPNEDEFEEDDFSCTE